MKWQEELKGSPVPIPEFEIDPTTTALMVIDMQNQGLRPDCGWGKVVQIESPEMASYYFARLTNVVIPNNIRLLDFFRRNNLRIIYVTLGPELPDGSDLLPSGRRRAAEAQRRTGVKPMFHRGTCEHSVIEELRPREGELVVNKTSRSAFNSTNIDQILRNLGIESLVITGVGTEACVETTARDAADRDYNCILVDDACGTLDEVSHNATMRTFAKVFGKVKTTEQVIREIANKLQLHER